MDASQGLSMRGSVTNSSEAGNENPFQSSGVFGHAAGRFSYNPQPIMSSPDSVDETSTAPPFRGSGISLPREITPSEGRTLLAGALGWLLDAMDVMLFSLVVGYLLR